MIDIDKLRSLAEENKRLRARLELRDHDWPESADGIACRDETIKRLDRKVEQMAADNRRLREALLRAALRLSMLVSVVNEDKIEAITKWASEARDALSSTTEDR